MESRGRVMVPVPAKAESGIQGPAQTLHPNASSAMAPTLVSSKLSASVFRRPYKFGNFYRVLRPLLSLNRLDNWPLCFKAPSNTDFFSSIHSTSLYHSHHTTSAFLWYTGTQTSYMRQLLQATFRKLTRIKPRDFSSSLHRSCPLHIFIPPFQPILPLWLKRGSSWPTISP